MTNACLHHTVCTECSSLLQAACRPSSISPVDWKAEGASLAVEVRVSNVFMTAAGCFDPRHPVPQTSHDSGFAVVLKVCQTMCPKSATLPFSLEFITSLYKPPSPTDPEAGHITKSLLLWTLPRKPHDVYHHGTSKAGCSNWAPQHPSLAVQCWGHTFLV